MLDILRRSPALNGCGRVLVALSGGRDSVCLLHGLLALGVPVTAGHVHHGIRAASDHEETFVRELCAGWGVPLLVKRVDAPGFARENRLSLEQAAREKRREALREMRSQCGADYIATAHHRQDQAETVLLNLTRGAGPDGLAGMAKISPPFIRPLLDCPAEKLARYAQENGLSWQEDESNRDVSFSRNRIRWQVLPQLEAINPAAVDAIARCAQLVREEDEYMALSAEDWLEGHGGPSGFPQGDFALLHPALQRRVIRLLLKRADTLTDVSMTMVERLRLWMIERTENGTFSITERMTARREYGMLSIGRAQAPFFFRLPLTAHTVLPEGLGVLHTGEPPADIEPEHVRVVEDLSGLEARSRLAGDRVRLPNTGTKKLKDILIDKKIPRARRDRLVVVAQGSRVVWAVGVCGEARPENGGVTIWWTPA